MLMRTVASRGVNVVRQPATRVWNRMYSQETEDAEAKTRNAQEEKVNDPITQIRVKNAENIERADNSGPNHFGPEFLLDENSRSFLLLLEQKGFKTPGSMKTDMSQRSFDKILSENPELRASFDEITDFQNEALEDQRIQKRYPCKKPVTVSVTGAAGAIGYALLFRIASGAMLGPDQPINLQLLELPGAPMKALNGVIMELEDGAFPLLNTITGSDNPDVAFKDADYACLVGAQPRTKGMDRADLLKANGAIFKVQGESLNKVANKETLKVVVVGNPANTNAWIASQSAPDICPTQFTALTRLDQNRGLGQIAKKVGANPADIDRFVIWGNHSNTMVPDISHTQITVNGKETWAKDLLDDKWVNEVFTPQVQTRGGAIIEARGASSAASAANATVDHVRDWVHGTQGYWTSMGVYSEGSYGAEEGIYYSYPVTCSGGNYGVIQNVPVDPAIAKKMDASNKELIAERDAVAPSLGIKPADFKAKYASWKKAYAERRMPYYYPPKLD